MINKGRLRASTAKRTSRPTSTDFIDEWQDSAACLDYDPNIWFPDWPKPNEYGQARRICQGCSVRRECLELALKTNSWHGMFGGLTPLEREIMLRHRQVRIPA